METKETKEPFAIVPQALTVHPNIDPSTKIILIHCLGKYLTKLDDGKPWTFSTPSIAAGTGLSERTVRRHIPRIRKHGVLKPYGKWMNGKKSYDVFVFVRKALDTFISTADKMSVVIPNIDKGVDALAETTADISADKLSDKMSDEVPPISKKVEGNEVQGKLIEGKKEEINSTSTGNRSQPVSPIAERGVAPVNPSRNNCDATLTIGERRAKEFEDFFNDNSTNNDPVSPTTSSMDCVPQKITFSKEDIRRNQMETFRLIKKEESKVRHGFDSLND